MCMQQNDGGLMFVIVSWNILHGACVVVCVCVGGGHAITAVN